MYESHNECHNECLNEHNDEFLNECEMCVLLNANIINEC